MYHSLSIWAKRALFVPAPTSPMANIAVMATWRLFKLSWLYLEVVSIMGRWGFEVLMRPIMIAIGTAFRIVGSPYSILNSKVNTIKAWVIITNMVVKLTEGHLCANTIFAHRVQVVQTPKKVIRKFLVCSNFCISLWRRSRLKILLSPHHTVTSYGHLSSNLPKIWWICHICHVYLQN